MRVLLVLCVACGSAHTPLPLAGSASGLPATCAVGADGTNRCWAADDEHEPLWTPNGRIELTSLLHVPPDFDARGCKLVARWHGSESGSQTSDQPASITNDGVHHWRMRFALHARDLAVRLEQTITCPNGGEFSVTSRSLVGDAAGHRICAPPLAAATVIAPGDNEIEFTAKPNVMLRARGSLWVNRCTDQTILDLTTLPTGDLASFVPETDDLTDGERFLAVRSTGGVSGPVPEELTLPSAILHVSHELTVSEASALAAMFAPAATALEIHGTHANPRPR